MKQKKAFTLGFIVIIGLLTIAAAMIVVFTERKTGYAPAKIPTGLEIANQFGANVVPHNDITITSIGAGDTLALPVDVQGTVKGTWFFEGSFPVYIEDMQGNRLGYGLAGSTEDWMTIDVIPFTVSLPAVNYQGDALLIFTKDNPSGEPQFDDSFTLPVVIQ